MKQIREEDRVVFYDSQARAHNALVTAVHGTYGHSCGKLPKHGEDGEPIEGEFVDAGHPSINLVYVTSEEGKTDSWGKQIERESSVVHSDQQGAGGNYWSFLD